MTDLCDHVWRDCDSHTTVCLVCGQTRTSPMAAPGRDRTDLTEETR